MGLRINTNTPALTALRNLRISERRQATSLERLSTGLRINHAQDDPSGLVISEILRTQIASLKQAVENSQNAQNLVQTSEAAIGEINELVKGIRESLIFALNTGGTSVDQVQAEQDAVDSAINAIKRISDVTRWGTTQLLNGNSSLFVISQDTSGILEVKPFSVQFDPTTNIATFQVNVLAVASQATLQLGSAAASTAFVTSAGGSAVTIRIRGPVGAEEVTLAPGIVVSQFARTINALRDSLGIYASADGSMYSEEFGAETLISIEVVRGAGTFFGGIGPAPAPLTLGDRVTDFGVDAVANLGGAQVSARGNRLAFTDSFFSGEITLNAATNQLTPPGPGSVGTFEFRIQRSGLTFQFGGLATAQDSETIGMPNLNPSFLGLASQQIGGKETGGQLTELIAGGRFDLFGSIEDLRNAVRIVDAALNDITDSRQFLGAFVAQTVETNIRANEVAIENLSASESSIRDLDFASEVTNLTKTQILFQSGISVLAQANLIPQSVIQLLQG
ncbi:MAG: flagellin [Planctomycetota bacterium]